MKTFFTSHEIPHIWAHQKAASGRSPGAMSFEGNAFYSYGARIATIYPAENAAILSSYNRSKTTNRHQSLAWRAVPSSMVVFRGDVQEVSSPRAFVEAMLALAAREAGIAKETRRDNPRRKAVIASAEARCLSALETAKACSKHFKLGIKCSMTGIKDMAKREADARLAEAKAREAREAARLVEATERLERWKAGENVSTSGLPSGQAFLRLYGDKVQTSLGIEVELREFKRALRFVFAKRAEGWEQNGERYPVAGYELNSVSDAGVVAGCHRFSWQELERIRALLMPSTSDLTA